MAELKFDKTKKTLYEGIGVSDERYVELSDWLFNKMKEQNPKGPYLSSRFVHLPFSNKNIVTKINPIAIILHGIIHKYFGKV